VINDLVRSASGCSIETIAPRHEAIAFDLELAQTMTDGDAELLQEIIETFRGQARELVGEITYAATNQDASALERSAHKLKGSAGCFGAYAVCQVASDLELRGRDGRMSDLSLLCAQLEAAVENLIVALDRHTSESRKCACSETKPTLPPALNTFAQAIRQSL
jgi:HPt (histidine-containing phosphotransfer) domain-containing protein